MEEKPRKPSIRFKGFTDDWEQRKVKDVYKITRGYVLPTTKTKEDFSNETPYPVYSSQTKNNGLMGYYSEYLYEDAITWTTDGANAGTVKYRAGKYYCTNVCGVLLSENGEANAMMSEALNNIAWKYVSHVGNPKLMNNVMSEIVFAAPTSCDEQKEISNIFLKIDNLITLHQRKCEQLIKIKKSLLEKMFPADGENTPKIRFNEFTEAWEQRKLGDIMNVTSVKRIHQSDWTDSGIRFLRARDIVSASKNEEPDDYLYISKEKYDEYSLVSGKVAIGDLLVTGVGTIGVPYLIRNSEPLYFKDGNIIWLQNGTKIDGDFFLYSFFGKAIQDFINESAGIGTVGTYTIESGKKTPISLPEIKEQQQIGAYFRHLDNLITLHQRKLEILKNIKKSLLEKMFA